MATQNSPGLQPWVTIPPASRPEGAEETIFRPRASIARPTIGGSTVAHRFGRPFRANCQEPHPGLVCVAISWHWTSARGLSLLFSKTTHVSPNAERRTPNAERRTPNAERRTPNAERRTPNADTLLGFDAAWKTVKMDPGLQKQLPLKSILDRPARFLLCPPRSPLYRYEIPARRPCHGF
jgi:hypothetical protein